MSLPAPNLDDRRFQDLVDDAKRLVQRRCPEWTDHNVSDPGVTLIETFAYMVDQLLYRVNQVPDRNYVKFLELIGVRLLPPRAARCSITFWLSAPQPEAVTIPAGTEVATARVEGEEPTVFTTTEGRTIPPCSLNAVVVHPNGEPPIDETDNLVRSDGFLAFGDTPTIGNALNVGLSAAIPGCAVALRLDCQVEGIGVTPDDPPLHWQAFNGTEWVHCDVDRDETLGMNQPGDLIIHVPDDHSMAVIAQRHAGWIRAMLVPPYGDQEPYSVSPRIRSIEAFTVGGTTGAVHARVFTDETVGTSEGLPAQRFRLAHRPVVPDDERAAIAVATGSDWETWTEVDSFAGSSPIDRHFVLDHIAGEVQFGPAVRQPDGGILQHGAVPPSGAVVRVGTYRSGGGRSGNVAAGALTVLKTSIPLIRAVTNRRAAAGGVDGETMENAKTRGPALLRTRNRAVTAEDYEHLVRESFNGVARVRVTEDPDDIGVVRVLIVPDVADESSGELRFDALEPSHDLMAEIQDHLDERRCVGARVVVQKPRYSGVKIVAKIKAATHADSQRLRVEATHALHRHFHPIRGGRDGLGWEFGRPVHIGEVYAVLQAVPGVEFVEDSRLFPINPWGGDPGEQQQRIELSEHALVFSVDHQVVVEQ